VDVGSSQRWPETAEELIAAQVRIGGMDPTRWRASEVAALRIASAWVCFARGASGSGAAGDPAWAAAVMMCGQRMIEHAVVYGAAAAGYSPGLLGLRIGPLLCEAVARLARSWDVLLVDATGRDHPRRAGLALHLGAVLDQPSVGVTNRALVAAGAWPEDTTGAAAPLLLDGETVGFWLRPRAGTGRSRCTPVGAPTPTPPSPSSWHARAGCGPLFRCGRHAESRAKPGRARDQVERHDVNGRARRALGRRTGRRHRRECRWPR
jgi:deoxyribonuclease V